MFGSLSMPMKRLGRRLLVVLNSVLLTSWVALVLLTFLSPGTTPDPTDNPSGHDLVVELAIVGIGLTIVAVPVSIAANIYTLVRGRGRGVAVVLLVLPLALISLIWPVLGLFWVVGLPALTLSFLSTLIPGAASSPR
jgi:hypothetical protein